MVDRLLREDPQQRRPRGRPAAAAGPGELAAQLHQLVEDDGTGRAHRGRLPAHAVDVGREVGRTSATSSWRRYRWGVSGRRNSNRRITFGGRGAGRVAAGASASTTPTCSASSSSRATPSLLRWTAAPPRLRPWRRAVRPRDLFQVNVEEGRHLSAMVYLLHAHFRRDGEEAEALLHRSGDLDSPASSAVQRGTPDWLSSSCSPLRRPGRQVRSSARWESAFDPLSRTCGSCEGGDAPHVRRHPGVDRIVTRTAELMHEHRLRRRRPARRRPRSTSSRSTSTSTTRSRWTCSAEQSTMPPTTSPPATRAAGRRSGAGATSSPTTPSTSSWSGTSHLRR